MVWVNIVHLHDTATQEMLQMSRSRLCSLIRTSATSPSTSRNQLVVQWVLWWDKDDFCASICSSFRTTPSPLAVTTTSSSTSATLASRGYHLHVVIAIFYSNQSISTSTWRYKCPRAICDAPVVTAGKCVVYLVSYILCIIDCQMYSKIYLVG
jgi:hypothetical protein